MSSAPGAPRPGPRSNGGRQPNTALARRDARRRRGCLGCLGALAGAVVIVLLAVFLLSRIPAALPDLPGHPRLGVVDQPKFLKWSGDQPDHGVDISFPQCGRTFQDLPNGFVIVGLDGGMPERANPCFAAQWSFARRQPGAAIYVNTADPGTGDPTAVGRRYGRQDVQALQGADISKGTPVWLDVELPSSWKGSQERHREVITAHLREIAAAGYPVGVYSAPALWDEITGDAAPGVPTWVGLGEVSAEAARSACGRIELGAAPPQIVQRIGVASDGRSLDRNTVCPATSLDGLIRPNR